MTPTRATASVGVGVRGAIAEGTFARHGAPASERVDGKIVRNVRMD